LNTTDKNDNTIIVTKKWKLAQNQLFVKTASVDLTTEVDAENINQS